MKGEAHPGSPFAARTLGEGLRLLQLRSGMRRDELARVVGVSSGSMSNYMNGVSSPSAAHLWRIAATLALSMGLDTDRLWAELGSLLSDRIAEEPGQPPVRAFVLVDSSLRDLRLLDRQIARLPGVLSAEPIQGPHDLIVLAEGTNLRRLVNDVLDGIHRITGVVRTTTCISLVE